MMKKQGHSFSVQEIVPRPQPAEEKCKQHHVELTAVQGLDETMPESEPRSAFVRPDAFRGKLP
jgi:hypothetical protein